MLTLWYLGVNNFLLQLRPEILKIYYLSFKILYRFREAVNIFEYESQDPY